MVVNQEVSNKKSNKLWTCHPQFITRHRFPGAATIAASIHSLGGGGTVSKISGGGAFATWNHNSKCHFIQLSPLSFVKKDHPKSKA
jgi:hypothetical protein